jgi:hypothetical protein
MIAVRKPQPAKHTKNAMRAMSPRWRFFWEIISIWTPERRQSVQLSLSYERKEAELDWLRGEPICKHNASFSFEPRS